MGSPPTIGVFADSTDRSMPIVDLAVALEERGFSGIFLNEHPHLLVEHARSQYPPGGEIPDRYARFWDPYVALSFVAARTGLEIGTCISLVADVRTDLGLGRRLDPPWRVTRRRGLVRPPVARPARRLRSGRA